MQAANKICARDVLEVVPNVMRAIRRQMRERHSGYLSMSQYRVLFFLNRHHLKAPSLSQVAQHLDVKLSTASRVVDAMVESQIIKRETSPSDRRLAHLSLSNSGQKLWNQMEEAAQEHLSTKLSCFSKKECDAIRQGLRLLHSVFSTPPK